MTTGAQVIIHMAASLDGFIARKDGAVDWMETKDVFEGGQTLDADYIRDFLKSIDCYVMGSRTYETALAFEAKGFGWAYGQTPTIVLTRRELPNSRANVEFYAGDLASLVNDRLRRDYKKIWVAGGATLTGELLKQGLADEVALSLLPVLIGEGIPFFGGLDRDVALHLLEVKAYRSGMVAMRHEVRGIDRVA